MNRFLAMLASLLIAGCSHTSVAVNSSGTAAGGTTSVGAQVTAGASGGAAVVMFAIAAVAIHASGASNGGTSYRANPFSAISPSQPAPELDGSRRVNEQDCSKPIKDWSAILKCR
jgi:hypothetical protein